MKIKYLSTLLLLFLVNIAFANNYTLIINNEAHDISLDDETNIEVGNQTISVKLEQKDVFTFSTENYSFQHDRQYAPNRSYLGDGVHQTAMMTPLGTLVMVQEYASIDPAALLDFMIVEVTKEERNYGYDIQETKASKTLPDGSVLTGKLVTSKYSGSDIKRLFYSYSGRDAGLFVMTQIDYEIGAGDEDMIDRFFNSLEVNMK